MKSIFASSIILFSLLLFGSSLSYARKEPAAGDYWKGIMKDKPMPKALKDLFHEDDEKKTERFVKNFEVKSSAIIYHSHSEPENKEPQQEKSIKPEQLKVPEYSDHQDLKDKFYQLHN